MINLIPGKLQLAAGLGAVAVISTLWFMKEAADSRAEAAAQGEANALQALSRANGEIQELVIENKNLAVQVSIAEELLTLSDQAATDARKEVDRLESEVRDARKVVRDAPETDNAPAAPVLEYAANSLRQLAESGWSVRTGGEGEASLPLPTDRPRPPGLQSED